MRAPRPGYRAAVKGVGLAAQHPTGTESVRIWSGRMRAEALYVGATLASAGSGVAVLLRGRWEPAIRFLLIAVLVVLARREGSVPKRFAGAFGLFALFAGWARGERWFEPGGKLDIPVHFLTVGSTAAVVYFLLAGWSVLPDLRREQARWGRAAPVLWVTMIGATVAVVWEFYEWSIDQFAPASVIVGYTDTIGDLLMGILGSACAGWLVTVWARRARPGQSSAKATGP